MTAPFSSSPLVARLYNEVQMPRIGFGTWQLKGNECKDSVLKALELGYSLIDTASAYENEKDIAEALKIFKQKNPNIQNHLGVGNDYGIFITSKANTKEMGEVETYNACIESLQRLNLKKIDLYLLHWPGSQGVEADSPKNRDVRNGSWRAMEKLYEEGKCRAIGVSNYLPSHLNQLIHDGVRIKPMVNQLEYHPLCQNEELLKWGEENSMQIQAYSSLGIGKTQLLDHPTVLEVSKECGKTSAQILLRWGLQKNLCVIPRTKTINRIKENFELNNFELSEKLMTKLSNIPEKQRFCWDPNTIV